MKSDYKDGSLLVLLIAYPLIIITTFAAVGALATCTQRYPEDKAIQYSNDTTQAAEEAVLDLSK